MPAKSPALAEAPAPIVAAYRERILYALAVIGALVIAPFSIGNFLKGYPLIGAVSMLVVVVFIADAVAIYLRRPLPVPIPIAFGIVVVALAIAIWGRGLLGIFWTFPAILLFHFVLERRAANVLNLSFVAIVGGVSFHMLEGDVALRIVAGQLLTIAFTNIFSFVVEAEQRKEIEQRRRLGLLVRATQAGFYQWERGATAVTYSGRLKEMLGHDPDADTSGWAPFTEFVHPEDRAHRYKLFQQGARDRSVRNGVRRHVGGDFRMLRSDGSVIWVHSEGVFICDADGVAQRYIASLLDVSERYRQEQALRSSHNQIEVQARQLRDQNEQLRSAIRVREEVERIARHDLKTPLNSILAALRLLREERRHDAREEELLGMVESAAYRVLDLVNLSVDIHRMEQGEYRFSPRVVDLTALAASVERDVHAHARTKGVRVDIRVGGEPAGADRRAHAWAEEMLCYSVIANLMKNAIEASPDGGTVEVDFEDRGARVSMRMRNAGEVPASVRQRFFEKYATYGKEGGSGLGTYSARLMALVQQGELTMRTSQAEGTVLELSLPAPPAGVLPVPEGARAATPVDDRAAEPMPALRVLVVDDDEFNLAFVRAGLPSPPLQVATAINGRAALQAIASSFDGAGPDVVFMDLEMPVMNGFEALERIRALERASGLRPSRVIAFSSYDDDAVRRRCERAGFDSYLSKPAPRERIHEILRAVASGLPLPEASTPTTAGEGIGTPVRVDPDMRAGLPTFLQTRRALIDELMQALDGGAAEAARRIAHKLAGSFALYGFAWAAAECRAIEREAAAGTLGGLRSRGTQLRLHLDTFTLAEGKSDERAPQAAAGG